METTAPWTLTGRGFILMYRFPEAFVRESCFVPEEWKILKWSGQAYVMLIDYLDSPVGPFHELLLMPGKADLGGSSRRTMSKVYCDSVAAMMDGRNNWGFPKELTDFKWNTSGRRQHIQVGSFSPWLDIRLETGSIPFPVSTAMLSMNLYQELDHQVFKLSPGGKGTGRFCLVKEVKADPFFFPELNHYEPSVALYIDPFKITYPIADVRQITGYY
jgi:hypothetical protein